MAAAVVYFHDFADEAEALAYAISSQRNRRNLTDADIMRCVQALDHRKPKGGDRGNQYTGGKLAIASREAIASKSSEETASLLGVDRNKVEKVRAIEKYATPEVKAAVVI